jgi:uncharacterized repeat protein (TIGR03803 family)
MKRTALCLVAGGWAILAGVLLPNLQAQTYTVLYSFAGSSTGGADGSAPVGYLVSDSHHNLYGVTLYGGDSSCGVGCGTVFKFKLGKNTETVLERFHGTSNGQSPTSVIRDEDGNLYGATQSGGTYGYGVILKINASGRSSVLYTFAGGSDGLDPFSALIRDHDGNLYGTASLGGNFTTCPFNGCGSVYRVDKHGAHTILYNFSGPPDGEWPVGGLVRDVAGNFYGTTSAGGTGACQSGCGVVFKIDRQGQETVLHDFTGAPYDGASPYASLTLDAAGNLYGTTAAGGASNAGTVFKLDRRGAVTVLHSFTGRSDGGNPFSSVTRDGAGDLYGTTSSGGSESCGFGGCGVVFRLDESGDYSVLHTFTGYPDGQFPDWGGLTQDPDGNLYGLAASGGENLQGVVFKITPEAPKPRL